MEFKGIKVSRSLLGCIHGSQRSVWIASLVDLHRLGTGRDYCGIDPWICMFEELVCPSSSFGFSSGCSDAHRFLLDGIFESGAKRYSR